MRSTVDLAVPGDAQPRWWHAHSHAKETCHDQLCLQSRRASLQLAEAAALSRSGGCMSCTVLTLLLLIYSPAFFFFFSPLHPLADGFPSDRTSPQLSVRVVPSAEL